jgi:uncharacterized membrane protein YfcA
MRVFTQKMDPNFLGVPDVSAQLFGLLSLATVFTTLIGILTGSAGGLALLAIMAMFFPPVVLVPIHTFVQLGVGCSRAFLMWRDVMKGTLLPFSIGAVIGASLGAQFFINLPTALLQGLIGIMIIILTWLPSFTVVGSLGWRFLGVGFIATFIGMFVSATGTIVSTFLAGSSENRKNHASTLGALMALCHLAKLVTFGVLGVALGKYLPLILAMICCAFLGNFIGRYFLNKMPEHWFRIIFKVFMTALALRLLFVAGKEYLSGVL